MKFTAIKDANLNSHLIEWHLNVNNNMTNRLKSYSIVLPLSLDKSIRVLSMIKGSIVTARGDHKITPSEIERAITIDYKAYNSKQFALYRGSDMVDDIQEEQESKNRSISFGSSLFAGLLCDYTASAYFYINKEIGMEEIMDMHCLSINNCMRLGY